MNMNRLTGVWPQARGAGNTDLIRDASIVLSRVLFDKKEKIRSAVGRSGRGLDRSDGVDAKKMARAGPDRMISEGAPHQDGAIV